MKTIIIVLVTAAVSSCAMKNDQIIAEAKKCHDAGLNAVQLRNEFGTMRVECEIRKGGE